MHLDQLSAAGCLFVRFLIFGAAPSPSLFLLFRDPTAASCFLESFALALFSFRVRGLRCFGCTCKQCQSPLVKSRSLAVGSLSQS